MPPPRSLIARQLAPDRRNVRVSPAHLEMHGEPATPDVLRDHRCIHLIGLESRVFDPPRGPSNVRTRGRFRTDDGQAVREACAAGLGREAD